jgi:hypothetical protein
MCAVESRSARAQVGAHSRDLWAWKATISVCLADGILCSHMGMSKFTLLGVCHD